MAQLSIFIDDKTLRKVERAAKEDNKSISRWVCDKIANNIGTPSPLKTSLDVDNLHRFV